MRFLFTLTVTLLLSTFACSGEVNALQSTETMVQADLAGTGGQVVLLTAKITHEGALVRAGEVVFIVNGVESAPVQVAALNSSGELKQGTASMLRKLVSGRYNISARYLGTQAWAKSVSAVATLDVPGFSEAEMNLSLASGGYDYSLQALDVLPNTLGNVTVRDVQTKQKVGATSIMTEQPALGLLSNSRWFASPWSLRQEDLWSDGRSEFVLVDSSHNQVLIYDEGDPNQTPTTLPAGRQPTQALVADLDADGMSDLVVVNTGSDTLSVFLQDNTNPRSFKEAASLPTGHVPTSVAVGDLNGDGFADIAVSNFGDDTVTIYLNDRTAPGTFRKKQDLQAHGGPTALAMVRSAESGVKFLAVSNYFTGTITVSEVTESPELFSTEARVFKVGAGPIAMISADLNGDGFADLVVANSLDGTLSLLKSNQNGVDGFVRQEILSGFDQPTTLSEMVAEDRYAPADLLVGDGASGSLTVLRNNGLGHFTFQSSEVLGASLSSVQATRSTTSGTYQVITLDPSLGLVHTSEKVWTVSGRIAENLGAHDGPIATLNAAYTPDHFADATVISNTVTRSFSKREQSIVFEPVDVSYGSSPVTLVATASSGLPVRLSILQGIGSLVDNRLLGFKPGVLVIEAEQAGNDTYAPAPVVQHVITVSQAPLYVHPNSAVRSFGADNPPFSGTVTGLVGKDMVRFLYKSEANATTPVGDYDDASLGITASAEGNDDLKNYQVSYSIGQLSIRSRTSDAKNSSSELPGEGQKQEPAGQPSLPILPPGSGGLPIIPPVGVGAPQGSNSSGTTIVQPTNGSQGSSTTPASPFPLPPTAAPSPVPPSSGQVPPKLPTEKVRVPSGSIVPIPIPLPIGGSPFAPLLPSLGISIGGGTHVTVENGKRTAASLKLFSDDQQGTLPGWYSLSVLFDCSVEEGQKADVLLTDQDVVLTRFSVTVGKEFRVQIPSRGIPERHLSAFFGGTAKCNEASSRVIIVTAQDASQVSLPFENTLEGSTVSISPESYPEFGFSASVESDRTETGPDEVARPSVIPEWTTTDPPL